MSDDPVSVERLGLWQQAVVLVAVTLAVFAGTLSSGFVYDSRLQVLTDSFLFNPANWWPVLTFGTLSMDVLDFNRPVNLASLMFDATLWGREPFGYHLTSILLHAANVVLVWWILRGLTHAAADASPLRSGFGSAGRPTVAALLPPLLFAVHPVVTEAVCEPAFREDLLVACFTLAGLALAMGHDPATRGCDGWRALGCAACSLLAIGSKESGITAPCVIGIYWLLCRRGERGWFWPLAIGSATAVMLAFLGARFLLQPTSSSIFESPPQYPGDSFVAALLIEPRILALYVQIILLPVNLCADYGIRSVAHLPLPVAIGLLAAVALAGVMACRVDRRMVLAITIVVVSLLPVANLIPIYRAAADRYLYLPLAGVALAAGFVLDAPWLRGRDRLRERLLLGGAAAVVLLGVGCMERQKVWANELALWTDAVRKNAGTSTAAGGLADALRQSGRLPEAEEAARVAVQLSEGRRGEAWATLALIYEEQGRPAEAQDALRRALEVEPRLADPDARVAVLAMERPYAEDLKRLLATRPRD